VEVWGAILSVILLSIFSGRKVSDAEYRAFVVEQGGVWVTPESASLKKADAAVYFDFDTSFNEEVLEPERQDAIKRRLGQIPSTYIQLQPSSRNQESFDLAIRIARAFVARFGGIVQNDEGLFLVDDPSKTEP
jgi:hypothetical protein